MPPLLQQVRGATVLTIYMTDTPSNLPVAYTNFHIHFICTHENTSHRLKRSEIFFHPEREKALPQ